jgi:hypothetical protein
VWRRKIAPSPDRSDGGQQLAIKLIACRFNEIEARRISLGSAQDLRSFGAAVKNSMRESVL